MRRAKVLLESMEKKSKSPPPLLPDIDGPTLTFSITLPPWLRPRFPWDPPPLAPKRPRGAPRRREIIKIHKAGETTKNGSEWVTVETEGGILDDRFHGATLETAKRQQARERRRRGPGKPGRPKKDGKPLSAAERNRLSRWKKTDERRRKREWAADPAVRTTPRPKARKPIQ